MHDLDDRLLRHAFGLARHGMDAGDGGPFGAVVARDGEVLGEGWNRVLVDHDPTAHAEVVAIRAACRRLGDHRLRGCTIYASCEPCPLCFAAAHWARVDRIVFAASRRDAAEAGFDDEALYTELAAAAEARTVRSERRLVDEGVEVVRAWLAKADRVPY